MVAGTVPVVFSYSRFIAAYPEFAAMSDPQLQNYFNQAGIYFRNDARSPCSTTTILETLLWMITAHLAWMMAPRDAQGNPSATGTQNQGLVGRINSAQEGSVSVQTEYSTEVSDTEAWWIQTKYGANFWAASLPYRVGPRYRPGNPRPIVPFAPGSGPYG